MSTKHLMLNVVIGLIIISAATFLAYKNQVPQKPEIAATPFSMPFPVIAEIINEHKHGAGKACKSEFPADWDTKKIKDAIMAIATSPSVKWRTEKNGYDVAEEDIGSVKVRVVVNRQNHQIVTSYPINVERNPCPEKNASPEPEVSSQ